MSLKGKEKRIDLRVTQEQKHLLERAADLKGMSLSAYLLSHCLNLAQTELEAHHSLVLSDRDRDLFMELLKSPPTPTPSLREAMAKFQQEYQAHEMEDRPVG